MARFLCIALIIGIGFGLAAALPPNDCYDADHYCSIGSKCFVPRMEQNIYRVRGREDGICRNADRTGCTCQIPIPDLCALAGCPETKPPNPTPPKKKPRVGPGRRHKRFVGRDPEGLSNYLSLSPSERALAMIRCGGLPKLETALVPFNVSISCQDRNFFDKIEIHASEVFLHLSGHWVDDVLSAIEYGIIDREEGIPRVREIFEAKVQTLLASNHE